MGKQIAIAATKKDEGLLLKFLRETAQIRIIESFAPTVDKLWVENFSPQMTGHWQYDIWNTRFQWQPEYGVVGKNAYEKKRVSWVYIADSSNAPVLSFSRSRVDSQKYGRLYWAKDFAAPNGLEYDVNEFSQWWDKIIRWVRKTSPGKEVDAWTTWFLPDAWDKRKINDIQMPEPRPRDKCK